MNKKIIIGLIVAILVAGGVFAGLSLKKEKKAEKPEAPKVSADINPLTGMKWKKNHMTRPFIVSTDNDSALSRPQAGLSQADILYEVPIEGGGSRYEPIYYSQKPGLVGAIRSCRPYIINIAREYNAVLVHNGKSPQAKEIFGTIDRVSAEDDFDIYHAENNPNLPGNLYTYGKKVMQRMEKRKFNKEKDGRSFKWLKDDEEVSGKDAKEIRVNYADGAYNTFKYDSSKKTYTKYVKDQPLIDANNRKVITCANILVQEVPYNLYDSNSGRLNIDMTKGGKATMFTQGKVVKGTWERKNLDSPTIFKGEDGSEFKMTPGVTCVQIIDKTVVFKY